MRVRVRVRVLVFIIHPLVCMPLWGRNQTQIAQSLALKIVYDLIVYGSEHDCVVGIFCIKTQKEMESVTMLD